MVNPWEPRLNAGEVILEIDGVQQPTQLQRTIIFLIVLPSACTGPNPSFRVIVKLAQLLSFWSTEWNCEALGRLRWRQSFRCKGLRQWRGTFAAPILICASGVFFFCDWLVYRGCVSNFFAQSMYQYLVVSRRTLSRPFNALSTVAVWTSPAASHGDFLPAVWVQASEHIYIYYESQPKAERSCSMRTKW